MIIFAVEYSINIHDGCYYKKQFVDTEDGE